MGWKIDGTMSELMLFDTVDLSVSETTRLQECEAVIERGIKTFVDVGMALMEIRDGRLYRRDYSTFEDYCRDKWGMSRIHAHRMIEAAEVTGNLLPMGNILPVSERQARPLASLPSDVQPLVWQVAVETAPEGKITARHVEETVKAWMVAPEKRPVSYHVSDDSYEWYTPVEYIEAARRVMGSIDLDPATSEQAQAAIMAREYYTRENDGLSHSWFGNVWLNPPYNMPLIEQFVDKAIAEYEIGLVSKAIVLTNNSTDTGWFHKLAQYPFCLTRGRIQFWNGEERLATRQGQAIFYLGNDPGKFAAEFSRFGLVVSRYDHKQPGRILI